MDETKALEILDRTLRMADAEAVVVAIDGETQACTRFADNVITQNTRGSDITLRITCAYGQQHATATTNTISEESLKVAVERAQTAARLCPSDPEYMPPLEAAEINRYPTVDGYFEQTAASEAESRAKTIRDAVKPIKSKGFRLSGAFTCGDYFSAVGNSAGLKAFHRFTSADIHTTVLGGSGSGWAQSSSNNVADLSVQETSARAFAIARDAQSPTDIDPGRYVVILSPAAVHDFVFYMICDAKATDEGRTFLRGKLGKEICGDNITIRSDPGDPRCPGPPFQEDGLVSPTLSWIEKGVLKNLSTSRFWAKKTGRSASGRPSNILMDGGSSTIDEMVSSTDRGILVIRFWYIRFVDPMESLLTGMTRDGLFLIENGKVTHPIKQLRFNESVEQVLNRVEMVGQPERMGQCLVPALKVRDFNFTSITAF